MSFAIALPTFYFFFHCAKERLIAGDEGFYATAAKLTAAGFLPYIDHFYPQMPGIPLLYGSGILVLGESWSVLRGISAVLSTIAGLLLYELTLHFTRHRIHSLAALALYCLSPLVFPWVVTVESYSLSLVGILAMLLLFYKAPEKQFLIGVAAGVAVLARLYTGVLVIPIALSLILSGNYKGVFKLSAGILFCLAIIVPLVFLDPNLVYFNNIGYHHIRSSVSFQEMLFQKIHILKVIVGILDSKKFVSTALPVLMTCLVLPLVLRTHIHMWCTSVMLFAISFYPTPAYVQYFCLYVPLALILFVSVCSNKLPTLFSSLTLGGLLVISIIEFPENYRKYCVTGEGVIGIKKDDNPQEMKISFLDFASTALKPFFEKEDTPAKVTTAWASWSGYYIGLPIKPLEGAENRFALRIATHPEASGLKEWSEIRRLISEGKIPHLLFRTRYLDTRKRLRKLLRESGYTPTFSIGNIILLSYHS